MCILGSARVESGPPAGGRWIVKLPGVLLLVVMRLLTNVSKILVRFLYEFRPLGCLSAK
eukprot:COSAG02_NODE_1218_length_13814_cov_250.988844_12_plen_59_part_00